MPDIRAELQELKDPIEYNMRIVELHLREENPADIDNCLALYSEDAVWEAPTRGVMYHGKESIKKNYLALFDSFADLTLEPIERFATTDRVVDDMWVHGVIVGDGIENSPLPKGTRIKMRLVHIFHIRDGL